HWRSISALSEYAANPVPKRARSEQRLRKLLAGRLRAVLRGKAPKPLTLTHLRPLLLVEQRASIVHGLRRRVYEQLLPRLLEHVPPVVAVRPQAGVPVGHEHRPDGGDAQQVLAAE